jgi:retron-type reverse transcriptase
VNWIHADIRKFFDSMDHDFTLSATSRLLRLIRKWLKVGVAEDG